MSTPAAERRGIVRRAIEAAIGQHATTRRRQTAPLTTAVWRVVEPAIAQRDAQLDAVREIVEAMDGVTGAAFWAEQLRAALRPQPPAAATPQPPLTWCAASLPGSWTTEPIGPCVLRAGHDGPVHQAASGAKWWPVDESVTHTRDVMTEAESEELHAAWLQHLRHFARGSDLPVGLEHRKIKPLEPDEDPPQGCPCGPLRFAGRVIHTDWCSVPHDPEPLRRLAAQALNVPNQQKD